MNYIEFSKPIECAHGKLSKDHVGFHWRKDGKDHFSIREENYQQKYFPTRQYHRAAFAHAQKLRAKLKFEQRKQFDFKQAMDDWKKANPFDQWLQDTITTPLPSTPLPTPPSIASKRFAAAPNDTPSDAYKKMISGELYDATDPTLLYDLNRCKDLCWEYNNIRPTDILRRSELIQQILGQADEETFINQPFYCDYGKHIRVGKNFFANFNFVVLDEAFVTIGDNCFIGPNVSILTACHSTNPEERNTRMEWALPVTIGDNVWIGGSVTILAGVTIGDGVTIGGGSVVTHDIPAHTLAVGSPARVIKNL